MKKSFTIFNFSAGAAKITSIGAAAILISACGGTGQDDGSPSQFHQTYSGLALDGQIARATVYLDTNENYRLDSWEPRAFTDNQGYYSYNPETDVDYCRSNATAEEKQYCLVVDAFYSNPVVRVQAGYDIDTGEPFAGQMSVRLNNSNDDAVSNTVISPLSSIISHTNDEQEQDSILNSINVSRSDLSVNYRNTDGSGQTNNGLLNTALKIHKTVTVLSDNLEDTYDELGSGLGTPNNAAGIVYQEIAKQLYTGGQNLDETLQNSTGVATVLDNAENTIRQVYERKEFDLPNDMGNVSNPGVFSQVINRAGQLPSVVNTLITNERSPSETLGAIRTLESIVTKIVKEESPDSSIDNAVAFFVDPNNSDKVNAIAVSMSADSADIGTLANNNFSGSDFETTEGISAVTQLPQDALPFTQIGGLQVRISELDLGFAPSDLKDSEVEFYFEGDPNALGGSLVACVKYINGADINGNLGEGNTPGDIVTGFWSLLGSSENNMESYSLLLTVTFLETTFQAIMKPSGGEVVNDIPYQRLRFDFDDDISAWHSRNGLVPLQSVPLTSSECEERLPSRIGL